MGQFQTAMQAPVACRTLVASEASAGDSFGRPSMRRDLSAARGTREMRASKFVSRTSAIWTHSRDSVQMWSRGETNPVTADSRRHRAKGAAAFRTESAAHELVSQLRLCPRETTRRSWRVTSVLRCAVTQSHRPRHRTEGHAQALIARACRSACNICGGARRQQRRSKRIPLHENRNCVS